MQIRNIEDRDLDALVRLDRQCFDAGTAYSRSLMANILEFPRCIGLVSEDRKKPCAFIIALWEDSSAEIVTVDVAADYRRQGLGSQLFALLFKRLNVLKVTTVFLHVSVKNHSALLFYKKKGFNTISRIRAYYRPGEDAYLLSRSLKLQHNDLNGAN